MNKYQFIKEIFNACSNFHWEFTGTYKHYEISVITDHYISISVISWGYDEGYAERLDFENDEFLLDNLISVL